MRRTQTCKDAKSGCARGTGRIVLRSLYKLPDLRSGTSELRYGSVRARYIEYWDNSIAYDGRVPSWGHRLQQSGVRVESIGKLHYRNETDDTGFDAQHIPMHIANGVGMIQLSIRRQFKDYVHPARNRSGIIEHAGPGESEYTRYDRKVADIATQWLRDIVNFDRPWTLFVSFVTPHYPLIAPKEYCDLYPIRGSGALMVAGMMSPYDLIQGRWGIMRSFVHIIGDSAVAKARR